MICARIVFLVLCLPLSIVITIALLPLWSWIEATSGIESGGHSGPADWCFWAVYATLVLLGATASLLGRRRA